VRPDYLSVTQSQYGWTAFTDGYYFNVVRSLPVISGHGGYHDFGFGYFNPSYFLEMARARDLARPNWYLPTWYGNTTADQFRLEQYLSFQTNIQGMISPPDLEPGQPEKCKAVAGIVESNHLMGRLGTIFTTMPVTRPPVAVLYSLSAMIHAQAQDQKFNYAHATPHGRNLAFTYLAGKLIQQPLLPIVEEDILDGTLAVEHRAVILTSLDYLDPQVVAALERFTQGGGLVLLTGDCTVKIRGAVNVGVAPAFPDAARIAALEKVGKAKEAAALTKMRQALQGAKQLADALRRHLEKAGIRPVLTTDQPGITATRQAAGATWRAVHLAEDRANVFRFFRVHQNVTIIKGSSPYNDEAAQRLVKILDPWNVKATTMTAVEANRPRSLSAEEAKTWAGLTIGRLPPGDKNDPAQVGFAVRGPVILLGTPEDNPLIKLLQAQQFLPYTPGKTDLPGPGRGLVAWQFDGVGVNQESITLIAYDPRGMAEAVGTMYEMLAGMEPLTPLRLARASTIVPATAKPAAPQAKVAWSVVLPDSVVGIKANAYRLTVLTHAGTLAEVDVGGKVASHKVIEGSAYQKAAEDMGTKADSAAVVAAQKQAAPQRLVKFVAAHGPLTAVAYWGGMVQVVDQNGGLRAVRHLPQDVTALAWSGDNLIVGDADGRLTALNLR
jgi:hypothetical protein